MPLGAPSVLPDRRGFHPLRPPTSPRPGQQQARSRRPDTVAETLPHGRSDLEHSTAGWDRARGQRGDGSSANLPLAPLCADSVEVDNVVACITAVTALVVAL